MKRLTVLAIITITTAFCLNAQVVDSAQLLIKYVPRLANSNKINRQAELKDTVVAEPVEFNYIVAPSKPDLDFKPGDMEVGKLNPEVRERYYRNYIKLGFGYPITPLAELSVHNCQNQKYSYGLNFHHFSSWANPIGKEQKKYAYAPTSDTRVQLFFNRIFKNHTLYSSIGYNHELANLYGFSRDWHIPDYYYGKEYRDTIRNNFNHVYAEVGFRSNYTQEERPLKEDFRVNYDFIHTYWKNNEHNAGLHGFLAYDAKLFKLGIQHYQLDINLDYFNNTWSDSAEDIAAGIKACVEAIRMKQPQAKLLLMPIFPREVAHIRGERDYTRKHGAMVMPKIAKVNELIRPLADGKCVLWFDLTGKFLDSDGMPDIKLLPDGTHPGPEGYAVWADALLPYLKDICGK